MGPSCMQQTLATYMAQQSRLRNHGHLPAQQICHILTSAYPRQLVCRPSQHLPLYFEECVYYSFSSPPLCSRSCQTLQQDTFCYAVLNTVQVATTPSHSLQGEVALDRFHQLTQISGRPFLDLTSNECSSAMQLAACMSVYSPCLCSGGSNFSEANYCSDVNFTLIVDKVLDVCKCNSLTQNCRLQLLLKLDRIEDAVKVVSPQDEGQHCQRLPEGELGHACDTSHHTPVLMPLPPHLPLPHTLHTVSCSMHTSPVLCPYMERMCY